jgi:hypothetical protein
MMKMNKPEWLLILIGCIASICNGGLQPATGIVMGKYISVCFEQKLPVSRLFNFVFSIQGLSRM